MRRAGFGVEAIVGALQDMNERLCRPLLDDQEVERIAQQAGGYAPTADLLMRVDGDGEPLPGELPLSDAGNAGRMVLLYPNRFRWVAEEKLWLYWDETRWARDKLFEVQRLAIDTARAMQRAALALPEDAKNRVFRHGVRSESAQGIDGMVKVARYLSGIAIESSVLDARRDLLNVLNGTLDLTTLALRRPDPEDLLTRRLDVAYDPAAEAPVWRRFLNDVFQSRQDVIDYVQRAVGYTLTGSIGEQCVFILHGAGANGKSTFVGALNALFGEYAVDAGAETFLASTRNEGRGPEPELMRLKGMRFAYVDELPEGRALDEERVKKLTGGETTSGRDLYKSTETFENTAKVWLDLNHLPKIEGVDYGIERRIRVIPFDRRFEDHEQDKQMLEKLKTELPGILAWAVEGCRVWRQRGLQAPAVVSMATRRYRDEHNHLPAFVEAYYHLQPGAAVPASTVQDDYAGFCTQREEPKLDYRTKVVRFLEDALKLSRAKTRQGMVWQGIRPRLEQAT
jgi:putative DNA primase/helicase